MKKHTYKIVATAGDITECEMFLNDDQLSTIISVFKALDSNRKSDYCPWYEIEDESGVSIYKTECM